VLESFLHFIWQYQFFNKAELCSTSHSSINIISPGYQNHNAGPDFSDAKIEIEDIKWSGNVEIHLKSSDWEAHKHDKDKAYDNVILHVVYENDKEIHWSNGKAIPTIQLKNRIDAIMMDKWKVLVNNTNNIPCSGQFKEVDHLTKLSVKDKLLLERLERKAEEVGAICKKYDGDWETTAYQLLARSLGLKVNAEPFLQLAKSIPFNVLKKNADSRLKIEALLFGQAGFLDRITTDYQSELELEYRFLAHKYQLISSKMELEQWKFARLRPPNFPTIRIAQFAAIICSNPNLFSSLLEVDSYNKAEKLLKNNTSPYWKNHYLFGRKNNRASSLGKSTIENIIINTIAPLLLSYGQSVDKQEFVERAIALLESTSPEKNAITRKWTELGEKAISAYDSQALIELYNNYCLKKKCLQCSIGMQLLKTNSTSK